MPRLLTQDDKDFLADSVWGSVSCQSLPAEWCTASVHSENHQTLAISELALAGVLIHGGDHLERAYTYVRRGFTGANCIEPAKGTINQHPILKHLAQFLEVVVRELGACGNYVQLTTSDMKRVFAGTCVTLFRAVLLRDLLEYHFTDPEQLLFAIYDELNSPNVPIDSTTGIPHANSKLAELLTSVIKSGMAGR